MSFVWSQTDRERELAEADQLRQDREQKRRKDDVEDDEE